MKLIVGLGNPGNQYEKTRHNAGFMAIDVLLERFGFQKEDRDSKSQLYFSKVDGEKVLFLKPLTFMNLSGQALSEVMNYYKIKIQDVFVIYDDKDLPVGKFRFRSNGSPGGHNGIKNIISHVGTENFNRLRIGVGTPVNGIKIIDWVLMKLKDEEIKIIKDEVLNKSDFVNDFVNEVSFTNIMNKFN
jgi:PTH1 family peptidyl-tRNA hydrolase